MVDPPVCRLMDYNKEMYRRRQKEKEIAKNKVNCVIRVYLAQDEIANLFSFCLCI